MGLNYVPGHSVVQVHFERNSGSGRPEQLAHAVTHSGWRDHGPPLLKPVIDALIRQNTNAETSAGDLRRVVAALHMDLALSPLYGDAFRRSVGLRSDRGRAKHLDWWAARIEEMLRAG